MTCASLLGVLCLAPALAEQRVVIGQTYEIAEPDVLTEIQTRAQQKHWSQWLRKNPKDYSAFETATLPRHRATGSYLFDPTYVVPDDLKDDRGKVLVAKGTRINVYERLKVPGRYIVVGATAADYAWLDQVAKPTGYDKVLIANGNVLTERQATNRALFALDARFVERFGLRGVPSIVQQEGTRLRVHEYEVK